MQIPRLIHIVHVACLAAAAAAPLGARAADKSGVSLSAISLPKGPGSIEGLGEAFQPRGNSGTAGYTIPVPVPPGPAGHAPDLTLAYEGGLGNGILGVGWHLAIPYIQRQTDLGIPRYLDTGNGLDDDGDGDVDEADEIDTFINERKEELVPLADGRYFCENEGPFIRYERTNDYWVGTLPTGVRMEFGASASARISDPATGKAFRWCLQRVVDTHGNTIEYEYDSFPGDANLRQIYCVGIEYGAGAPPWTDAHLVRFEYEDRPDWFEDCRSGFRVRTGKRLSRIVVATQTGAAPAGHAAGDVNLDGTPDFLNRILELEYLDESDPGEPRSLLHRVALIGADGQTSLPAESFSYTRCLTNTSVSANGQWLGGSNEPTQVFDQDRVDLVDLNGDGLPDVLKTLAFGGGHWAALNQGETETAQGAALQWGPLVQVASQDGLAWNADLAAAGDVAHLADMDGDGLSDLVVRSALGEVSYFRNLGTAAWGARQAMTVSGIGPPSPFGHPNTRSADIDFDKRMDVVESISSGMGADYRVWLNLGDQQFAAAQTVPQSNGWMFAQAGVFIADFNGDRVPDLVRLQPAAVTVAAGLGYGRFADPVLVPLPDAALNQTQLDQARLHDVSGDGLEDLVIERAAPGQVWCWFNRGNYTFGPRRIIYGIPGLSGNAAVRWADMNGNGTVDLVVGDSASIPRMLTVDLGRLLGCAPAPYLLTGIDNGIGRRTSVAYASSVSFALADASDGIPWTHRLPFSIPVVASIVTSDSLGGVYTNRFRYHDGYYDIEGKEFRGFGGVDRIEVGGPGAPTLVTRTTYDTGRDHEALKGKIIAQTAETETGEVFWQETTAWTVPPVELHTGVADRVVRYAHPTTRTRQILERGQGTPRTVETAYAYDAYGNVILLSEFGVVETGNPGALDDEKVTETTFAIDEARWMLRYPCRTEIRDEHGAVLSRAETFYDDETFSGANFGQIAEGDATLVREWIDAAQPSAYVDRLRTAYSAAGNPVLELDPLASAPGGAADLSQGHVRTFSYDADFSTFPVQETVHVGEGTPPLVHEAEYDPGFGVLTASRDFNQHQTDFAYDALGRLIRIVRPGDSAAHPTTEYLYELGLPVGASGRVSYVETRRLDREPGSAGPNPLDHYLRSREYVDGLGRTRLRKQEAESDPQMADPRVVVRDAVTFNARRGVAGRLQPYFTAAAGDLDALLGYEDITAPGWQGLFHQEGNIMLLSASHAHRTGETVDALERPVLTVHPDGSQRRIEREPLVEIVHDENDEDPDSPHAGTPHAYRRDGRGRLVRTDQHVRLNDDGTPRSSAAVWTTVYAYDLNDRLVRVTDAQGNVKTMAYDGLQRVTAMDDPDRGAVAYTYDPASNLTGTQDGGGRLIHYAYDGANRLQSEDYLDQASPASFGYDYNPASPISPTNRPDVVYLYDHAAGAVDFGDGTSGGITNARGQLAAIWDLSGEEYRSYDARGRLAWSVKRLPQPQTQSPLHRPFEPQELTSFRTGHQYDAMDRLREVVYPDNDAVEFHYNNRGLPAAITGTRIGSLLQVPAYHPADFRQTLHFGNGIETRYRYDARQRLTRLRTLAADYIAPLDIAYEYDAASNILTMRDLREGIRLADGDPRRDARTFEYDDLYRLTRTHLTFNLFGFPVIDGGESAYRYDRIGNMLARTTSVQSVSVPASGLNLPGMHYGGSAGRWNRIGHDPLHPGPHALSAVNTPGSNTTALVYDPNGNPLAIDDLICTWDYKNRLVAAENASMRAEYVYDHADRRVVRSVTPKGPDAGPGKMHLYVDRYFEVRPQQRPAKYVWNGNTRVCRTTLALSTRPRLQRLYLRAGWNLVGLSIPLVTPPADHPAVNQVLRWDAATHTFVPLAPNTAPAVGDVLWVHTDEPATLAAKGIPALGPDAPFPADGVFVTTDAWSGTPLAAWTPPGASVWRFDADTQQWIPVAGDLPAIDPDDAPPITSPGEVIFVRSPAPFIPLPSTGLVNIAYYHPDHLGSTRIRTDGLGNIIEETTYLPFGAPRTTSTTPTLAADYGFTQKERDDESALQYFEARYLAAPLGRFLTPDPKFTALHSLNPDSLQAVLRNPTRLNPYAYARNNPIRFFDPDGLEETEWTCGLLACQRHVVERDEYGIKKPTKGWNDRLVDWAQRKPGDSDLTMAGKALGTLGAWHPSAILDLATDIRRWPLIGDIAASDREAKYRAARAQKAAESSPTPKAPAPSPSTAPTADDGADMCTLDDAPTASDSPAPSSAETPMCTIDDGEMSYL